MIEHWLFKRLTLYFEFLGFDAQYLAKKNGIIQLGNYLHENKAIHPKKHHIIIAIGTIRNMASHGKEAKSMKKWDISHAGGMGNLLLILSSIKSLFHYVNYEKQIF